MWKKGERERWGKCKEKRKNEKGGPCVTFPPERSSTFIRVS